LLVDGDGLVLETDRANLWIVEGGRRLTPPADGRILPGITRARLLAEADSAEEPISIVRLGHADAVLLSSSIALVRELAPTLVA
jgi:para-aminobenzoate synthetase/4-amino-4-deoxychorismate lyase